MTIVTATANDRAAAEGERLLVGSVIATTMLLWIGASAIIPLLPTYLHRHGTPSSLVGVVMASNFAFAVLTQYPVGRLCDRAGSRVVLLAGLAIFALGSIGFVLQTGTWAALVYRSTQGVGIGAAGVASAAMLSQRVRLGRRGRAFALLYGSQSLALAIGPLLGGLIGASSMRVLFATTAVLAGLAALPLFIAWNATARAADANVREIPTIEVDARSSDAKAFRRALFGASAVFAAIGLLTGLYETCWSLLLATRRASPLSIGLSWTLFCLPFALLSARAGALADAWNRKWLVAIGISTSSVFAVIYPELRSVALLVMLGGVESVGAVLVTPAALSMLSEHTPEFRHGATQGVLATVRTGLTAAAAAGAGALFGLNHALPFYAIAAAMMICLCFAVRWWCGLSALSAQGASPPASYPL